MNLLPEQSKLKRVLLVASACIAVGVLAVAMGQYLGGRLADDHLKRLAVLWPDPLSLPENDRALLAWLSMECDLSKRPDDRANTVACLREAAGSSKAQDAIPDAQPRLARLLDRARGT